MRVSTTVAACVALALALSLAACGSSSKSAGSATADKPPTAAATGSTPASAGSASPAKTTTVSSNRGSGAIVSGSSGGLVATMRVGTHNPRVNDPWPPSFKVSRGGQPVKASVSYQFLFAGQIVARRSHYTFTGHFVDSSFQWPSAAVGYPLTFRAVIASGSATINLDYPVQVIR